MGSSGILGRLLAKDRRHELGGHRATQLGQKLAFKLPNPKGSARNQVTGHVMVLESGTKLPKLSGVLKTQTPEAESSQKKNIYK